MTFKFGTENIYYVPQSEQLHIYDLYNWRLVNLDVHSLVVSLNPVWLPKIKDQLNKAYTRFKKGAAPKHEQKHAGDIAREVINVMQVADESFEESDPISFVPALPMKITVWTRISDSPQESFFDEDYKPFPNIQIAQEYVLPIYGALAFSSLDDYEINLTDPGTCPIYLSSHKKEPVSIRTLADDDVIPFAEEFFGAYGNSGKSRIGTYDLRARITEENLCCVPLYKIGDRCYVTLYLHIKSSVNYDVTHTIHPSKARNVWGKMKTIGFKLIVETESHGVFKRNGDTVHFYVNSIGDETAGLDYIPPLFLVVRRAGSLDPEERSKLTEELRKVFK